MYYFITITYSKKQMYEKILIQTIFLIKNYTFNKILRILMYFQKNNVPLDVISK